MLEQLMDILRKNELTGIMEVAGRLVDIIQKSGTVGKAPDLSSLLGDMGFVNLIPSNVFGECRKPLIVLCYDQDSLHDRLREMLYHAGIVCARTTTEVCFLTSHFEANVFESHRRAVEVLRTRGVKIVFLVITANTVNLLAV